MDLIQFQCFQKVFVPEGFCPFVVALEVVSFFSFFATFGITNLSKPSNLTAQNVELSQKQKT